MSLGPPAAPTPPRPGFLGGRISRRRAVRGVLAVTLLTAHLTGMGLAGFSRGFTGLAVAVTFLGFLAVPVCAWELSRLIDFVIDRFSPTRTLLAGLVRLLLGLLLIAGTPQLFRLLGQLSLDAVKRAIELSAVFLSISVATGLVLVGLAIADLVYAVTARFRSLSTRLMAMLLLSTWGTLMWFVFLAGQAKAVLAWAVSQGHLESYQTTLQDLTSIGDALFGGAMSVVGVLELPFVLLLAWRFGRNATHGLTRLSRAFQRVGQGDLTGTLTVEGNDEVAEMQRGFNQMLDAARERRFLETAFGRYVSPVVVDKLKRDGGRVPSERRHATVLFSDIRGFTSMSAEMAPEQVIAMLNGIMSTLIEVVARHDGYINKFIGDAMLVVWNAPLEQSDHAVRAVRCALDMQDALKNQNARGGFGGRSVHMGIGINSGPLVMGNLGNERQVEFAILGDTVNTASRCCGQADADAICVTAAVVDAVRAHDAGLAERFLSRGLVALKGKGSVELFGLHPPSAEAPAAQLAQPPSTAAASSLLPVGTLAPSG